jgi:hypothetical protein
MVDEIAHESSFITVPQQRERLVFSQTDSKVSSTPQNSKRKPFLRLVSLREESPTEKKTFLKIAETEPGNGESSRVA